MHECAHTLVSQLLIHQVATENSKKPGESVLLLFCECAQHCLNSGAHRSAARVTGGLSMLLATVMMSGRLPVGVTSDEVVSHAARYDAHTDYICSNVVASS